VHGTGDNPVGSPDDGVQATDTTGAALMDKVEIWRHIHEQRRALAGHLATLDEDQWEHASLCAGWTVRDVAAHVISTPQIGWAETLRLAPALARGYNRAVFHDVKRRGLASPESILADYERFDGSRHRVPLTTVVEPLIDVLVHTQDILRPLGVEHHMPPGAAAVAAGRARLVGALFGTARLVRSHRLVATDTDWARGRGTVVEAPMEELLMLVTGRTAEVGPATGPDRRTAT
jgi:uncharacterized protein (TIGR03083 family)